MVILNDRQLTHCVLFRVNVLGRCGRCSILPNRLLRMGWLPIRTNRVAGVNVGRRGTAFVRVLTRIPTWNEGIHFAGYYFLFVRILGRDLRLASLLKDEGGHVRVLIGHGRPNFVILPRDCVQGRRQNVSNVIRRYRTARDLLRRAPFVSRTMCLLATLILVSVSRRLVATYANLPICNTVVISLCVLFSLFGLDLVSDPAGALSARFNRIVTRDRRLMSVRRRMEEVCLGNFESTANDPTKCWSSSNDHGGTSRSRAMFSPTDQPRPVNGHLSLVEWGQRLRICVPLLGCSQRFVCRSRASKVKVATLCARTSFIVVAIEGASNALARDLSALNTVRRVSVRDRDGRRHGRPWLSSSGREARRMSTAWRRSSSGSRCVRAFNRRRGCLNASALSVGH